MSSFAPKIRVEVYVPIRYEPAYQNTLSWLIEEFTELRGGCTVHENVGGYYLSSNNEVGYKTSCLKTFGKKKS